MPVIVGELGSLGVRELGSLGARGFESLGAREFLEFRVNKPSNDQTNIPSEFKVKAALGKCFVAGGVKTVEASGTVANRLLGFVKWDK